MFICFILIMTWLGAIASLLLKKARNCDDVIDLLKSGYLWSGTLCYLIAAILNVITLCISDYSKVLPLTSLTYIWTLILSSYYLKEHIGPYKICGVALIVIGALLIV